MTVLSFCVLWNCLLYHVYIHTLPLCYPRSNIRVWLDIRSHCMSEYLNKNKEIKANLTQLWSFAFFFSETAVKFCIFFSEESSWLNTSIFPVVCIVVRICKFNMFLRITQVYKIARTHWSCNHNIQSFVVGVPKRWNRFWQEFPIFRIFPSMRHNPNALCTWVRFDVLLTYKTKILCSVLFIQHISMHRM